MEDIPAEHVDTVNELIPAVATAIDSFGGLCRLDLVCNDPEVRRIRNKLPKSETGRRGKGSGFPSLDAFRMTKILAAEKEFFTLLDGNDKVCTALAYEEGLVNHNGEITEAGKTHLGTLAKENNRNGREPREPRDATLDDKAKSNAGPKGRGKGADSGKGATGKRTPTRPTPNLSMQKSQVASGDLRTLARKLHDAALRGDDREFNDLVNDVKKARKAGGAASTPIKAPLRGAFNALPTKRGRDGPPPRHAGKENVKRVETGSVEQQVEIERLMRSCAEVLEKQTEQKMKLCHLADAQGVKTQKHVLNGVGFGRLFDTAYPQFFLTEKDERNQMSVQLICAPTGPLGTQGPEEMPKPFTKKRKLAEEGDDVAAVATD